MRLDMSSGLNCEFLEAKPGEWYLILEDSSAPKVTWDWHEYATAYGPFETDEDGREFLRDNFSNPGGYWTIPYGDAKLGKVYVDMISEAKENLRRLDRHRLWIV
jgi:hypothetical protein